MKETLARSPALDRIVEAVRNASESKKRVKSWHIDAHTDSGGGWHSDAWKG